MLSPEYIDHLPDRVVELYADLEIRILEDMARRISKTGALTETAQWQMWRLEQIGAEREFIRYHLQRLTGKTQGEINELLVEAGEEALYYDDQIYRAAGLSPKALRDSEALQKIIKAGSDKTMRLFENLTSTTADTASRQFENALDAAYMDITSGAFSYQDAVRSAVKSLSKAGIDAIIYPSGHTDKMDVAVRRAVLTGVNQTTARIQTARADEMECDLVETTAHMGARPEHMDWQGRIFSRSGKSRKYPDFVKSTGYGTGPGLCGWNCRHSFFPYFEGLSERAYSRAKLREYENKTVTYNGRTLPYYDATQQQRYLERQIRRWKREYLAMDAAGLDTSEASAKLAAWRAKQKDFLTQTGLGEDKFRSQVYGFGRSQAARARAQAERKKITKPSLSGILNNGEEGAILRYISGESYSLNEKLRNGRKLTRSESIQISALDSALNKMPKYKGLVERSLILDREGLMAFAKHHTVGTEVLYPAFTSASVGGEYHESPTVLLRIKSKTGRDLRKYNNEEQEVLFSRNCRFHILSAKIENKVIVLEMEEV